LVLPTLALGGFNTFGLESQAKRQLKEFTEQGGTETRSSGRSFHRSVALDASLSGPGPEVRPHYVFVANEYSGLINEHAPAIAAMLGDLYTKVHLNSNGIWYELSADLASTRAAGP
jgi:hypothetical protein